MEKMCTVPWSLATHRRLLSLLKLTQNMFAGWEPRLSMTAVTACVTA